jgi:hypothetical protein
MIRRNERKERNVYLEYNHSIRRRNRKQKKMTEFSGRRKTGKK